MTRIAISGSPESAAPIPVRVRTIWTPPAGLQLPSAPVPTRALFYRPDTRVVPATTFRPN